MVKIRRKKRSGPSCFPSCPRKEQSLPRTRERQTHSLHKQSCFALLLITVLCHKCPVTTASRNRNNGRRNNDRQDANGQLVISNDVAAKIAAAANLMKSLYSHDDNNNIENKNLFSSFDSIQYFEESGGISAWYVAKKGGVCYGIPRGTDPDNLLDIEQNLNVLDLTISYGPGTPQCRVHKGFYFNFVGTTEESSFLEALDNCVTSCSSSSKANRKQRRKRRNQPNTNNNQKNGHCELVLASHSQGGSSAVIGSILYASDGAAHIQGHDFFFDDTILPNRKKVDPLVITFGAAHAVEKHCDYINSSNHYRFVNLAEGIGGITTVDIVPMLPMFGAQHNGHALYWNAEGDDLAYLGLNYDKSVIGVNVGVAGHTSSLYQDRSEEWFQKSSAQSTRNRSRQRNRKRSRRDDTVVVQSGFELGSSCVDNEQCSSGRCDGVCKAKMTSCSSCNENADCQSGKCVFRSGSFVCAANDGTMDDGCYCDWSSQCSSGRCEGAWPPFECKAKLKEGERCNENSDCSSGQCTWRWRCS
jgi:hypothetical protein